MNSHNKHNAKGSNINSQIHKTGSSWSARGCSVMAAIKSNAQSLSAKGRKKKTLTDEIIYTQVKK